MTTTQSPLVITRTFDVPRERLFEYWSNPDDIKKWWGPTNYTCPFCSIDFQVGGKYLSCMRSAEGQDFWSTGTYREILPGEKIVCTDSFADEQGNVVPASHYGMLIDWPLECLVTVVFEENDGKTTMTLTHEGIPDGIQEDVKAGWNQSFDKLSVVL